VKRRVRDLLLILALGGCSAVLLSAMRSHAQPRIARFQELDLKRTILDAGAVVCDQDEPEAIDAAFAANLETQVLPKGCDPDRYYRTRGGMYIFKFTGRGVWGPIEGVVALRPDLGTVNNVRVVWNEETPGLGSRISEDFFLDQFRAKKTPVALFVRQRTAGQDGIDAISGATMSSRALVDAVNESVQRFGKALEAGDGLQ